MLKEFCLITLSTLFACSQGLKKTGTIEPRQDTLRVMSYNIWLGGLGGGKPIEKTAEVIRLTGAHIVGMQETKAYNSDGSISESNGEKLAELLGWNVFAQQGTQAIITTFGIVDSSESKLGVKLKIGNDRYLWFFNCHLYYMPYQPYQLAGKPYGDFPFISTEKEAIAFAKSTRQADVNNYLREINNALAEGWPVLLTGDFNEPSFQDWTEAAVKAGLHQIKVEWPATKAFADLGMFDAYRMIHPDEVKVPGETWSSIDEKGEIHDRIDFIFYHGKQLKVKDAQTIGFKDGKSGIGINDYPSDHRAVYASFIWSR